MALIIKENKKKRVIALVGPTGIGKTKISIEISKKINAEIISVDSIQVYSGMDIGTAKPTIEQRKEITHHMIDICSPDHIMTVAEFQKLSRRCIDNILNRGKIPFLVGGSGLYVRSVIDDLHFADNISNKKEREKIRNRIETEGLKSLYKELIKVDEEYSKKIGSNDIRRIVRALEVYHTSGKKFSSFQKQWKERKSIYDLTMIGLNKNRDELYDDIEKRVDNMISSGFFNEVKGLLKKGYGNSRALKKAIGYREILSFFNDELTKEETINLIKKNTRNFAKRQLTWLKADPRVNWFFVKKNEKFDNIIKEIIEIIL